MVYLQQLRKGQFTKMADVEHLLFQRRVEFSEQPCPDQHSDNASEQSIERSLSDSPCHRPGAVSQNAESCPEDQASHKGRTYRPGFRMEFGQSGAAKHVNSDLAHDNGRQHDLENGKIRQEKLSDNDIVSRDASLLKQKTKDDSKKKPNGQLDPF